MFFSGLPWQKKLAVKGLKMARVKATDLVVGEVQIVLSFAEARNAGRSSFQALFFIRYFRNEKGTGAEICPAIVSGIVTGTRRSAIGQFFLCPE